MSTQRPRITVVGTGGTIAGAASAADDTRDYVAGQLDVADLLAAVPQLEAIAALRAEQLFSLDSKDMMPAHWLALGRRVQALADDPEVDGIVVTHGTDTLEETAYYLHITLTTAKPVVMTAAMRPATALSADGPLNLYQAVQLAGRPAAGRAGVLAVLGDRIHPAARLRKHHPSVVDAFSMPDALTVRATDHDLAALAPRRHSRIRLPLSLQELPAVELLTVAAGSSPALALAVALGLAGSCAAGLVLALPGNASLPKNWEDALAGLPPALPVVLASRCGGGVALRTASRRPNRLDAGGLDPLKARVRLIVGLGAGLRGAQLRRWFERD